MIPFSAGSGTDTIGRIVAGGLSQVRGQQVIVENRAGAAGNIGAELAAKAPADGYTLFLVNMGHAAGQAARARGDHGEARAARSRLSRRGGAGLAPPKE